MLEQFTFALNVTAPILILLVLGITFRRTGFIDLHFINIANSFVFNITLPCLLFFGIAKTPLEQSTNIPLFVFASLFTLFSAVLFWLISLGLLTPDKRGIFVQASFRGNLGIIGIALVLNAYGTEMLAVSSLYMAIIAILENPISVFVLRSKAHNAYKSILTNPIIIAVALGLVVSALHIPLPTFLTESGQYLAQMTLPLALICIGGSLYWKTFQHHHKEVVNAAFCKLIVMPLIGTSLAIKLGFTGQNLGLIYLMLSTPTSVSSYVMAEKMTKHGAIAAEMIALSTASSTLVITVGLVLLQATGYL